jgi:5-methylcytosine-specific restriction protein A
MPRRASKVCSTPGCPNIVDHGRCPDCTAKAETRRGTARQRGYDERHARRFRRAVLARDPICKLCHTDWSKHADHWPLSRRDLELRGLDPNDPQHGRGLCARCHSSETAALQPGGWNARS